MSKADFKSLVEYIKKAGCIPTATPFDEASVDFAQELELPILKIASSDLNDWVLIEKIATTRKPVIASTGGSSLKDIDDLVTFFENRRIPLAINHCIVSAPFHLNFMLFQTIFFGSCEIHADSWHNVQLIFYSTPTSY